MNLHLLDPSKLPDRIDSTLTIPRLLHPPMRKRSDEIALEAVVSPAPSPVDGATESTFEEVKMDKIPKKKSKLLFQKKINLGKDVSASDDGAEGEDGEVCEVEKKGDTDEVPTQDEETQSPMDIDKEHPKNTAADPKEDTTTTAPNDKKDPEPTTTPHRKKKKKKENKPANALEDESTAWTSCYAVSFNRNGTYLASGYASGLIPVHSFMSRCLSAVYSPPSLSAKNGNDANDTELKPAANQNELQYIHGVTFLSWEISGRYLLAGGIGDAKLRLMDHSHPVVGWDCAEAVRKMSCAEMQGRKDGGLGEGEMSSAERGQRDGCLGDEEVFCVNTEDGREVTLCLKTTSFGKGRLLQSNDCQMSQNRSRVTVQVQSETSSSQQQTTVTVPCIRHSTIVFQLPASLHAPCILHPAVNQHHVGVACMIDWSLALFYIPPVAFYEMLPDKMEKGASDGSDENFEFLRKMLSSEEKSASAEEEFTSLQMLLKEEEATMAGNIMYLIPPATKGQTVSTPNYEVTAASFGKNGDVIYAGTKDGKILGFDITPSTFQRLKGKQSATAMNEEEIAIRPSFAVKIPGGAETLQIVVSKNGKYVLTNSTDCALRLYDIDELKNEDNVKPKFVFKDLVSKRPFACCDFSADGEYVVGGCNSYPLPGDNYNLFMWNVVTGDLLDQLTGPQVSLTGLSCHPTRPFIAVSSSDGIVDVWGPRINWIAFAPEFKALQHNVLYEERENEFDVVVDGEGKEDANAADSPDAVEDQDVDVHTMMKTPAFGGDSQHIEDPFYFETRVLRMIPDKPSKKSNIDDA